MAENYATCLCNLAAKPSRPRSSATTAVFLPSISARAKIVSSVCPISATRALITIANASGADIRRITLLCNEAGLQTRIIPGIYEIVGERVNLSRIREVAIEDLLGREPVKLDEDQILQSVQGKVVMVTGAGGSIGSELCRQVCRFAPARVVLIERFENASWALR